MGQRRITHGARRGQHALPGRGVDVRIVVEGTRDGALGQGQRLGNIRNGHAPRAPRPAICKHFCAVLIPHEPSFCSETGFGKS